MSRRNRTVLAWIAGVLILATAALPLLPAVAIGPWVLLLMIVGFALLDGVVQRPGTPARLTEHDHRSVN